jgi:hypothetical protein
MANKFSVAAFLKSVRFVHLCALVSIICANYGAAQTLPREIRGYKVHKTAVSVTNLQTNGGRIKLSVPVISDVSFSGVKVGVSAGIEDMPESGRVDFLTFYDFKINGLPVTIDEYREPFSFQKGENVVLPKPIDVNVSTTELLRVAKKEYKGFGDEWLITGHVFVFGKFRKFGMQFRRVVPIDINLRVKNPLSAD